MNQIAPNQLSPTAPAPETPAQRVLPLANPPRLLPARLPGWGILIGPAALLIIWQAASLLGFLSPRTLASPLTAIVTAWEMASDGTLLPHLLASAQRAYLGLAIGLATGLICALLAGLSLTGEAAIDGLVQVKRAIPTLALIPLGILWLGIGETMKVALIATAVFVPIYLNTHAGLRGIDLNHAELAQSVGLSHAGFIWHVALPSALPSFFTGLRLAVTTSWTALVVLEQINTTDGIGYLMNRARDFGQTEVIVVCLGVYATLGLASDVAVRALECRALAYRHAAGT